MKTTKRLLSVLLALIMVVGIFPISVFATGAQAGLSNFDKKASFKSSLFDDVSKDDWYYDNVKAAYEFGIMEGKGAGSFGAGKNITLADAVTIAARLHSIYYTGEENFEKSDPWYQVYVDYAEENGIVAFDEGADLGRNATRAEFAAILASAFPSEALEAINKVADGGIPDVDTDDTYAVAIYKLYRAGVLTGSDDEGTFKPNTSIKRREVAAIVSRMADASLRKSITLAEKYTVTFISDGTILKTVEVFEGDYLASTDTPEKSGYKFGGWLVGSENGEKFDAFSKITSDLTLYASWTKNTTSSAGFIPLVRYAVTFNAGADDVTGMPAMQLVFRGGKVTEPTAPSREGYTFTGWYTDASCTTLYDFARNVSAKLELYAGWVADTPAVTPSTTPHNVTFAMNDGSTRIYKVVSVNDGACVAIPDAPERAMYVFAGWFSDPYSVESFDFSAPIKDDITVYAKWTGVSGGVYGASSDIGTIYSITGIKVENGNVSATINVNDTAVLVIEFLDENTEDVLATVSTQTPGYGELISVTIPIGTTLPEHYIVRAKLLDGDGNLLCNAYKCIFYTTAYENFSRKTVNDFDGKTVLNFDDDTTDNFGVLSDDVKSIECGEDSNKLTLEGSTYKLENASDDVKLLSVGDSILLKNGSDLYLFAVASITNDEGTDTVILSESDDTSISNFYVYLKLDYEMEISEEPITASQLSIIEDGTETFFVNAAQYNSVLGIDMSESVQANIGGSINWQPNDNVTVTGEVSGTGTIEVDIFFDIGLFDGYYGISVIATLDITVNLKATAHADNEGEDAFKEISFETINFYPIPGLSIYIKPSIPISWSLDGSAEFNYEYTLTCGFKYDSESGLQKVDKKQSHASVDIKAKVSVTFGPKIAIGVSCLGAVSVELCAFARVTINGSTEFHRDNYNANDSKHNCILCVDGEILWFIDVDANLKIKFIEEKTLLSENLYSNNGKIKDFYVSIINPADGMFGGSLHVGDGDCPNYSWKTTFSVHDESGNVVNSNISVLDSSGRQLFSGSSSEVLYLCNGSYKVKAVISGNTEEKAFIVNDAAQEVSLYATEEQNEDGILKGKVVDLSTNQPIVGASVVVYKNLSVYKYITTDTNGDYQITLADGTYDVEINHDGYVPHRFSERIEGGTTLYIEKALMLLGDEESMGGISGYITDAVTGNPISGAKITLRKGWNNTTGAVVAELSTGSDGKYIYDIKDVYGVIFGLQCGNYCIYVEKDGYISTTVNVIVTAGQVNTNQNGTLSPVMGDGEYRFVLRWGEYPHDLDSHLVGPNANGTKFHVYYGQMGDGDSADLDLDDVTSYGPETVTIRDERNGKYVYAVHNYSDRHSSNSNRLALSGAYVTVYKGSTAIARYNVPTNKDGTLWTVFSYDTSTGIFTLINEMSYEESPRQVLSNVGIN